MPRHDDPTELEPRPRPVGPGGNSAQLRRDIESGATGDRIGALDPAAAPLGTDAEAAGAPPPLAVVEAARARETQAVAPHNEGVARNGGRWLAGLLIGAVLLAVLAWWLAARNPVIP